MKRIHSGLGIASFIMSVSMIVFTFILLLVAGVMQASTPGGLSESSPQAVVIGLLIIISIFLDLIAIGLGIAGLVQKNRIKVFAVLGTVFSAVILFLVMIVLIIGNTMI